MKQYTIELFKGHPLLRSGNDIILIDTGAPSTIHTSETFKFYDDSYYSLTNYMGLTVQKISVMLGTEITTLLGADILSNYQILFDYKTEMVTFSKSEIPFEGSEIAISNFMGIPIVELSISHQKLKFFLDTGAKLSYVSNVITKNFDSIGTDEDFYPGVGVFETEYFEIISQFGNKDFNVRYGNLPPLLQMTLMLGGTNGIIGFDFFNNFQVVLDLKKNVLKYQ
jgi:hypothetical protein